MLSTVSSEFARSSTGLLKRRNGLYNKSVSMIALGFLNSIVAGYSQSLGIEIL